MRQPEGLKLMWYKCDKCKKREQIWNSRPRVTPLMINCSKNKCNGLMTHVDWELDKYAPDHIPKKGERIFVDWSKEAAEKYYKSLIEQEWNGKYPMSERYKTKEEALQKFMVEWTFGQPSLETV